MLDRACARQQREGGGRDDDSRPPRTRHVRPSTLRPPGQHRGNLAHRAATAGSPGTHAGRGGSRYQGVNERPHSSSGVGLRRDDLYMSARCRAKGPGCSHHIRITLTGECQALAYWQPVTSAGAPRKLQHVFNTISRRRPAPTGHRRTGRRRQKQSPTCMCAGGRSCAGTTKNVELRGFEHR
jgi:hypothetical protein